MINVENINIEREFQAEGKKQINKEKISPAPQIKSARKEKNRAASVQWSLCKKGGEGEILDLATTIGQPVKNITTLMSEKKLPQFFSSTRTICVQFLGILHVAGAASPLEAPHLLGTRVLSPKWCYQPIFIAVYLQFFHKVKIYMQCCSKSLGSVWTWRQQLVSLAALPAWGQILGH